MTVPRHFSEIELHVFQPAGLAYVIDIARDIGSEFYWHPAAQVGRSEIVDPIAAVKSAEQGE